MADTPKLIRKKWEVLRGRTAHTKAWDPESERRSSFFAGAAAVYAIICEEASQNGRAGSEVLADLQAELKSEAETMRARWPFGRA